MSKRKTVGWVVFAALMALLLVQTPRIASAACYFVGTRFYAAGNYQGAVGAFKGSVRLYPRFARGYVELGSSYIGLKKYAQAEEAFLKAKSIDDDSCASCGLGMTYNLQGRHDDAEREFKRAITLNPRDVCGYDQLAMMYYDLGKYPEAIAGLKRALTIQPSRRTYVLLANAYVYTRDFDSAVDAYKKAIQLDPKHLRAHYQLAVAYDYMHRYKDALAEYEQVIKLNPDYHNARYSMVIAYMNLHNKTAALEQYEILKKVNAEMAAGLVDDGGLEIARDHGKEKLYFVPFGNFSAASLTKLVNWCKQKTGVEVTVMQAVPFALTTVNKQRQQVIAEEAIALMKVRYPNLGADPNAVVIGLTDEDLFIRKEEGEFAFGYRHGGRFAVVSSARMNPANLGVAADGELLESRLRRMVLREIGVLYYQYPLNHNPRSLMFDNCNAVDDFDLMGEDF